MGKVDVFQVAFQDAKTTFFPGEVINGILNLKVNSELKLRGIRLEFHGAANVFLSSGDQRRKRPANSEVYIDLVATLFGKGLYYMHFEVILFTVCFERQSTPINVPKIMDSKPTDCK